MDRAEAEIAGWVSYFLEGVAVAFERVHDPAESESARGGKEQTKLLRGLDAQQRKALARFLRSREGAGKEIGALFGFQPSTAALLCQCWVGGGFLEVTDPARTSRRYRLNDVYEAMFRGES